MSNKQNDHFNETAQEARDVGNWTDRDVNRIIKTNRRNFIKDCMWLLDCEEDCLKTAGFETEVVDNIRSRFIGHFKIKL